MKRGAGFPNEDLDSARLPVGTTKPTAQRMIPPSTRAASVAVLELNMIKVAVDLLQP